MLSSLSFPGFAFYVLVLIGAFAVRSAAGFGAVLVAVPMLTFVMPVSTAVSVATVLTAITSLRQVSRDWRHIAWQQFAIVSFYTMIGVGLGFYFIRILDQHALRRGLGGFLIVYSVYSLWTAGATAAFPARWHGLLAAATGILGGLCGALFGGGVGPIYVVYFNILRVEKEIFRVTLSTVMLFGGTARIAGYASFGFYRETTITLIAVGLPLVIVGSRLGDWLAQRLDPQNFCRFVGGLVLLSGFALLLR